ncbi:hypothetical protein [Pseudacidovorax intermedius]|nr:hypothetical protein [Pseudacidovorax intermedius]
MMLQVSARQSMMSTPPADPAELPVQPDRGTPLTPGQQPPSPVLPAMRGRVSLRMRVHHSFMRAAAFRWRTL